MTLSSAIITLILVMDPLGNIPIFLSVLRHIEPKKRQRIILRESLIAFVILVVFLFFGQYILEAMSISQPAVSISGGIILFLIAIRMIFPPQEEPEPSRPLREPFIVPLAIPLLAGPSTMAIVMLLATQDPHGMERWLLALCLASLVTTLILVFADYLAKFLGERGIIATERLMGMILTTIAVQMFLNGIEQFFGI
jgi:multiple antibiotic resistance protein